MQVRVKVVAALALGVISCCLSSNALASTERRFEVVSPAYKGGFGATHVEAVSPDGNAVAYFSPGEFEGSPAGLSNNVDSLDYLARRGDSGWATTPIVPPDVIAPFVNHHDISKDLSRVLDLVKPGSTVEEASLEGRQTEFLSHITGTPDTPEDWTRVGPVMEAVNHEPATIEYSGGSVDFCHMVIELGGVEAQPLISTASGAVFPLYEVTSGCNGETPGISLVALDAKSKLFSPQCRSEVGIFHYDSKATNAYNGVSADGSEVFFTTCIQNNVLHHQLFVRLGGTKTLEVSRPIDPKLEGCGESQIPCPKAGERPNADFEGASSDGSRVFFTTSAPLVVQDKDAGNDLYMAQIGCPSAEGCVAAQRRVIKLVRISSNPNGGEGRAQQVVRVAPDGARVYYVASGDLLNATEQSALEVEGRPVPRTGADNLYVYDVASEHNAFIGDLCSGYESSGTAEDSHCPSKGSKEIDVRLWSGLGEREVQTAGPDGRFLVFASYAQLTTDDTDVSRDIYRYDAKTGSLQRVSGGEEGFDNNGNGPLGADIAEGHSGGSVLLQDELDSRTASEDGSRVIFSTAEGLSPAADNGLVNTYEWHAEAGDGKVSLISGGDSETPVNDAVITEEGNDVFFVTSEGLLAQDTDGEADIYDARIGGGFPVPAAAREPCSSDACQGPLTNPAPLLIPGSASQAAGENLPPPAKPKAKPKKKRKKRRKRAHRSRRAKKAAQADRHRGHSTSTKGSHR